MPRQLLDSVVGLLDWTETRAPNSNLIFDFVFDFCPIIWRQLISRSLRCHIPFYSFTHTRTHTHTIRSTRFGVMFFFFHKLFYLLFLLLFVLFCFCLFFSIFVYVFSVFWWLPLKLNKRMFIIYIYIYLYNIFNYQYGQLQYIIYRISLTYLHTMRVSAAVSLYR